MNKAFRTLQLTYAAAGSVVIGLFVVEFLKQLHIERKKRKSIDAWERENIACIQNAREDLFEYIMGEDFSWDGFNARMREHSDYLSIVRNQPKY